MAPHVPPLALALVPGQGGQWGQRGGQRGQGGQRDQRGQGQRWHKSETVQSARERLVFATPLQLAVSSCATQRGTCTERDAVAFRRNEMLAARRPKPVPSKPSKPSGLGRPSRPSKPSRAIKPRPTAFAPILRPAAGKRIVAPHAVAPGKRQESGSRHAARVLTGQETLAACPELIAEFEREEIQRYASVYFLGTQASKLCRIAKRTLSFADEAGDYAFAKGEHLDFRYEVQGIVGRGSFGQVLRCVDHKTKRPLAVKVIRNKAKFRRQALVELKLLKLVREKKGEKGEKGEKGGRGEKGRDCASTSHVVRMLESFQFRGHVCISFPLLSWNLYELVKANEFRGLGAGFVRAVAAQLCRALSFLGALGVVHSDIKPENILLVAEPREPRREPRHEPRRGSESESESDLEVLASSSSAASSSAASPPVTVAVTLPSGKVAHASVQLIDLGSSCLETEQVFTYVQSRFYRAPEVILGVSPYGPAIDMWSLGCVLAELFTGLPLLPGENERDQLLRILELRGVPPLERAKRRDHFFHESSGLPRQCANATVTRAPATKTLEDALALAAPQRGSEVHLVDFVANCLQVSAVKRIKPAKALAHPFLVGASAPVLASSCRSLAV